MVLTVRDVLLGALDELGERSFRRFCDKITEWEIEEGYGKIRRGMTSKANTDDVVDLILKYYTCSYGPALTVDVLNAINEKQVALDLKKDLENVKGFSWKQNPKEEPQPKDEPQPKEEESTSGASSSSASKPQEVPFVDKHREALIARIPHVAPILDGLISGDLLTTEENDIILTEKTAQAQMRKLYESMRQWSASHKRVLYEVLKEKNPLLVEDLEQS